MPELNPLSNEQIFLKKIAENTGSNYNTGDVSEINPLTIDQILLKEIAANTAGQSGDITELEEKVSDTQDMISDAYDSTHTYNVGDYCIYEDVLYKCNTASTTGTWDSSKWDAVTVAHEVGGLSERVSRIIGLGTIQEWNGDLDVIGSGMFKVNNPALASNLPNTTNLGWIVFSDVAADGVAAFGFQIAIGYDPGETYVRRLWATWNSWIRLDT